MTGHVGGRAPAEPNPAAPAARTTPETQAPQAGAIWGSRPDEPGSGAVPPHPFPAPEPAPLRTAEQVLMDDPWLFKKAAPDGHVVESWLVDDRDYDDRIAVETFWADQRPGWTVAAKQLKPRTPEPVT